MIRLLCIYLIFITITPWAIRKSTEEDPAGVYGPRDLPSVFPENHPDLVSARLKMEAAKRSSLFRLPADLASWNAFRINLRDKICRSAGIVFNPGLPLNIRETGRLKLKGYTIRNIYFQTRPGIYETANLYVPDGKGPFPGVINIPGHWNRAKIDSTCPQAVGHTLALNGYVCLTVDPWGSGERTTVHGIFEDHGDENNLGTSIISVGETLPGLEISDNIRGIDLLSSLPEVDKSKIGATGASGGGSQTMWLASVDERIKAVMLVVSAGTFEAHIMGTPCICEVLPGALTFTEESGVLALIAPRALKMCSHKKDDIPAFQPAEMMRSYNNVKSVYRLYNADNKLNFSIFDLPHGYWSDDRQALLGWFDLHLKGVGDGSPVSEKNFSLVPEEKLMVFPAGKRDSGVITTAEYCRKQGVVLRNIYKSVTSFDTARKRSQLKEIIGISEKSDIINVIEKEEINGWKRFAIETSDNKLLPLILYPPKKKGGDWVIVLNPDGKKAIAAELIQSYISGGTGVAVLDLSGTGEASAIPLNSGYSFGRLRVISRSEFWFGRTIMSEWIGEIDIITGFLRNRFAAGRIIIDGTRETGLAGLYLAAVKNRADSLVLRDAPLSYLFDTRKGIDFYSSGVFIPGFLNWGDISLAAALTGKNILFINPRTISGNTPEQGKMESIEKEYAKARNGCSTSGKTYFR